MSSYDLTGEWAHDLKKKEGRRAPSSDSGIWGQKVSQLPSMCSAKENLKCILEWNSVQNKLSCWMNIELDEIINNGYNELASMQIKSKRHLGYPPRNVSRFWTPMHSCTPHVSAQVLCTSRLLQTGHAAWSSHLWRTLCQDMHNTAWDPLDWEGSVWDQMDCTAFPGMG